MDTYDLRHIAEDQEKSMDVLQVCTCAPILNADGSGIVYYQTCDICISGSTNVVDVQMINEDLHQDAMMKHNPCLQCGSEVQMGPDGRPYRDTACSVCIETCGEVVAQVMSGDEADDVAYDDCNEEEKYSDDDNENAESTDQDDDSDDDDDDSGDDSDDGDDEEEEEDYCAYFVNRNKIGLGG